MPVLPFGHATALQVEAEPALGVPESVYPALHSEQSSCSLVSHNVPLLPDATVAVSR